MPQLREIAPGHFCSCHFAEPNPIKDASIEL
jgi:oligopeptide transport system ATP-binding protein